MVTSPFVLLAIAAVLAIVQFIHSRAKRQRLPEGSRPLPGPKGLPLIGRVHDVPEELSWLKFYEWSKEYGPIYQMEIFGGIHVWISDEKIAHDLLSKRSSIYSDRPVIANLPDNRTSGNYLALLGRTDTWKRQRKLCHHLMTTSAQASLNSYPTVERDRFLYLMSQNSNDYIEYIEQFTSRTVSRLSWGSPHPAKVLRKTTLGLLETISPAGALPNIINWLTALPTALSPWKKKEKARRELEERLFTANVEYVQKKRTTGDAQPSFIRTFLEDKEREQGEKGGALKWADMQTGEAMNVVGLMAIAGALTIGSPIQSYLLAMCHYPDWQRKLQDEIETVCQGRCPEWEDREKLPMLRAVIKEVIRWRPPVPTGIPHAIEEDDVYNGYFIPKGATIHAMEWGITRNEETYPDAERFNPDRWLSPAYPTYKEPLTHHPNLAGYSQFGFGRRTCQGIPIVEQDLFLAMGGLAWAFDVRKRRDPTTGDEIPVHWNTYTSLLIAKPVPFAFDAVPRGGPERVALLERMYERSKAEDEELVLRDDGSLELVGGEDAKKKKQHHHHQRRASGPVTVTARDESESESDHDVLINVRESSPELSDSEP